MLHVPKALPRGDYALALSFSASASKASHLPWIAAWEAHRTVGIPARDVTNMSARCGLPTPSRKPQTGSPSIWYDPGPAQ
ncbi:hypothetical protein B0H14DRAFT_3481435 [Mycena olivaceomarginata]|nr:hypothetical protein B0H14DRAFT_3481435 [Mycena olivaceomarginata]